MLKRSILFVFLLGLLLVNGFSQQPKNDKQMLEEILNILTGEEATTKPLTWDIVNMISKDNRKKILESKEIDYYMSADIVLTSRSNVEPKPKSGGLEVDHGDTETKTIISKTIKGKCFNYNGEEPNKEYFEIEFNEYKIKFKRNIQTGIFGNPEIMSPPNSKAISVGALPYLCVNLFEKGAMKPQSNTNNQRSQPQILNAGQISGSSQRVNQLQSRQNDIIGRGTLSRDVIVSYIYSRNSKPLMSRSEINILVNEYINEAMREGVNHDIAIAQMCYATGFLSNNKVLSTNNFGGLNTDKGISVKYGNRHASIQEGVWAHIQHLKAYASYERPKREIVDRRYYLLADSGIIGTITTLNGLFATWAPYNSVNYGNEIRRILNDMYRLSNRNI